jgi:PAS domain S-box-containing protein
MFGGLSFVRANDLIILKASPKFESLFGYGSGELIGKHVAILNAPTDQFPEDVAKEIMFALQKKGKWKGEVKNIRKDGVTFWSNASVSVFDDPKYGKVFLSIHTNITPKKSIENELEISRKKFQIIADHTCDWEIWYNPNKKKYMYVSPACEAITGYSPEEFYKNPDLLEKITHPEDLPLLKKHLQRFNQPDKRSIKKIDKIEFRIYTKNRQLRYIEHVCQKVLYDKEKTIRASNRDITERKELQQKLLAQKQQLIRRHSHEIRNPLAAQLGILELLEPLLSAAQFEDSEKKQLAHNCVQELVTAIKIQKEVADRILEGSRRNSEIENEFFDPKITIKEVMDVYKRIILQKGLEFKFHDETKEKLLVCGDSFYFRQIIINLITNANKFTDKGHILICLSIAKKDVDKSRIILKLVVEDTGMGMSKEDQQKLFSPFFKIHERTEGSGFGLSDCKNVIQKMGGNITVSSELNQGTQFVVTLPFEQQNFNLTEISEAEEKSINSLPQTKQKKRKMKNILVVDDELTLRTVYSLLLSREGYMVTTAENGKSALEKFRTAKPPFDIVFMDLNMPQMNGFEATQAIRELEEKSRLKSTPIIIVSGNFITSAPETSNKNGITDHLTKPCTISCFEDMITKYCYAQQNKRSNKFYGLIKKGIVPLIFGLATVGFFAIKSRVCCELLNYAAIGNSNNPRQ